MKSDHIRKGARSLKDIPTDILSQLNNGEIETVNLMEWLAVDQYFLLKKVLTQSNKECYFENIESQIAQLKNQSVLHMSKLIGQELMLATLAADDLDWFMDLLKHRSDSVRCWVCYGIAVHPNWTLTQKFEQIKNPAQDSHFGVREVAWMAMRPLIIENLDESLSILTGWAKNDNANVRRFACEATRPRGVWCNHIQVLKNSPQKALALLDSLSQESEKYVKDSVGNWLNDASKSDPDFVQELCQDWKKFNNKDTDYMIKRALRTLVKNKI